jgi:2-oxoglutarate dehydrogenase E2 component (dihydrolipoamide succinyltransferase)
VDSEIPSPVAGVISKILFEEGAVVAVGDIIAIINLDGTAIPADEKKETVPVTEEKKTREEKIEMKVAVEATSDSTKPTRFYSPLVKTIAKAENIGMNELEAIEGSGLEGRVKKQDILNYIQNRTKQISTLSELKPSSCPSPSAVPKQRMPVTASEGDTIVQMDRMRKLIAENMILSKQISAHVTNFIEADVTNLVLWRNKVKDEFEKREKQKLTFMPFFIEATAKALKEFPGVNASVDGDKIILRKNINIGIAVALPTGNLIVPILRNADQKSILGLTVELNKLADNARNSKLSPDDVQGGTFTISNFGSFKNLTGTPIINQPQVAILATGAIEKKPAVLETPSGDVLAIRHKIMLALTFDHRIVDGSLGGAFLYNLAKQLENFDVNLTI